MVIIFCISGVEIVGGDKGVTYLIKKVDKNLPRRQ